MRKLFSRFKKDKTTRTEYSQKIKALGAVGDLFKDPEILRLLETRTELVKLEEFYKLFLGRKIRIINKYTEEVIIPTSKLMQVGVCNQFSYPTAAGADGLPIYGKSIAVSFYTYDSEDEVYHGLFPHKEFNIELMDER